VLRDELLLGRRELGVRFRSSPSRSLGRGELIVSAAFSRNVIYRLIAGWACHFRDLSHSSQAIVDIYLPGDVVGLDAVLWSRPLDKVMTLTSLSMEVIDTTDALGELMSCRSTALYIAWLLGQRQSRSDRHIAAISSLDARGRVATMLLDLHRRLQRQRLITGASYNLPLTQAQLGAYLGLTVAHLNRVLRCLRNDRIASLEKHCITILDFQRLTRLAKHEPLASPDEPLRDEGLPSSSQFAPVKAESGECDPQHAAVGGDPPLDSSLIKSG
jgi:CRP/FNR family transcriptional regulator, anaerobic regulatory protein